MGDDVYERTYEHYYNKKRQFIDQNDLTNVFDDRVWFVSDFDVKGGRGKGGPAVNNAINAHVDDKIAHLIQIAKEFKAYNDAQAEQPHLRLDYPTLYLLRLENTKRTLGPKGQSEEERIEYFNSAMAEVFPKLPDRFCNEVRYPGAFKVITSWAELTEDIIRTSRLDRHQKVARLGRAHSGPTAVKA